VLKAEFAAGGGMERRLDHEESIFINGLIH
jgi:hypothetical protein